jgi:AraC family transcriptional activator of pobA
MKKTISKSNVKDLPVFDLNAFSKKAGWSDFYIQNIRDHVKEHAFVDKPHKHDFYLILFVERGNGVHTIDFVQYAIDARSLFLMTPGQVHTWSLSKDIEGWVIFFAKEFYEMHLSRNSLLEFPFYHSLVASPLVQLSEDETLKFVVRRIHNEFTQTNSPDLRLLRAYLDVFLLEAAKSHQTSSHATHGNTYKLRKLERLIEENFRTLKRPNEYGELMNLAPSYLNDICKDSLGRTLTDLIQGRLLLEAKRIFAYSDMDVKEVATQLNFSDASYFVRWFKKQNGSTPEEFRKSL